MLVIIVLHYTVVELLVNKKTKNTCHAVSIRVKGYKLVLSAEGHCVQAKIVLSRASELSATRPADLSGRSTP